MPIDWPRFVEIVHAHPKFLLTSHVRTDCDALGSEIAMALVLEASGKQATIVNPMATPDSLAFIAPEKRIKALGLDVQPEGLDDFEVLVVLDTSSWIQLGSMANVIRASGALKIVMDHHVGGDDMGAEMFKDTQAEAAGSIRDNRLGDKLRYSQNLVSRGSPAQSVNAAENEIAGDIEELRERLREAAEKAKIELSLASQTS